MAPPWVTHGMALTRRVVGVTARLPGRVGVLDAVGAGCGSRGPTCRYPVQMGHGHWISNAGGAAVFQQHRGLRSNTRRWSSNKAKDNDRRDMSDNLPEDMYKYKVKPETVAAEVEHSASVSGAKLKTADVVTPETAYGYRQGAHEVFEHPGNFQCEIMQSPRRGLLRGFQLGYETWGKLNEDRSNAVLLHTGLSASSHARSTDKDPSPGWWQEFVGPGLALDTNKYFVVCANVLGGCYGSTGPSSLVPGEGEDGERYALSFPLVTIADMVRTQFLLLDSLGIDVLHASVGSSMGGMQSLAAASMYPDRVNKVVTISGALQAHPTAIALRYMQRRVLMSDPLWNNGNYYNGPIPAVGLKHARQIATISYRSGPEWEERFARNKSSKGEPPSFKPEYLIESYIDYQGSKWVGQYDPNSLLYISKAMDMFDMSDGHLSLAHGVARVQCPALVVGATSDILFPITQQRQIVDMLRKSGNTDVSYYELNSIYGHDTFLIDVAGVSTALKGFLM
eukprot:m.46382 g.46382  ORF g.46382 m.46382 type:complete len:508 (+) comp6755_c0_seq1:297-1820(+)